MAGIDVESDPGLGIRGAQGIPPANPPSPTDGGEALFGAAFRQTNSVVSALQYMRNSGHFSPVPDYNPLTDIKAWREPNYFLEHGAAFVGAQSPAETLAIKAQIDQETKDKKALAENGGIGFVASTMAGILDPTLLLPGGVAVDAAKGGLSFSKAALAVGKAGLLQTTAQEALLQGSQQTRELSESALNIASGTLLTALIGGGAASLLSRTERAAIEAQLHADRRAINEHAQNPDSPEAAPVMPAPEPGIPANANEPAPPPQTASVGAAASDTRQIELVDFGLNKVPVLGKVIETTSPMQRLFGAESVSARRAAADLAETSLLTKENLEGGVTTSGPALSREATLHINQLQVAAGDELTRLFSEYRFGEQVRMPRARAGFEDLTGRAEPDKLTFDTFKEQVTDALRAGDVHENPQVQAAAQYIRNKVFEPWKKRAIEAGLFGEDVDVKTADGYVQRVYNKQAIAARRPEFVDRVTDWLQSDQSAKAQAKEKIGLYQGALDVASEQIEKLQAKIEARSSALEKLEIRQEEVRRFNEFAFKRSSQMSEPLDVLRRQITRAEEGIAPHLARLETIRDQIREQKAGLPDIVEADRWVRRLGEASQRMRGARDSVEAVDAAGHYVEELNSVITEFRQEIRDASQRSRDLRLDPAAHELAALEQARADINETIIPQQKQLRRLRKDLREERAARIQKAQGGAVFETQIRQRGNNLADRVSGRDAEIEGLEQKLATELQNHDAMRAKIEKEIAAWEGKSVAEAKSALKARDKAEAARAAKPGAETGSRLTSADKAIDKTVRRIMKSDRDLSRDELRSRAQEITDRIIGSPDGRLPYDLGSGGPKQGAPSGEQPRGPLAGREFNIPDETIKDFLENDIEHIVGAHLRTMVPDVLLTEKFGDVDMTEAFRKINDDYAALSDAAKSDKERTRLEKQRQRAIDDLAAVRDRIRGIYGISSEAPLRNVARAVGVMKNLNVLTSMGAAALTSLPDMAGTTLRHGLTNVFNDAWSPFFQYLARQSDAWPEAGKQYRAMGIAVESVLAARHHALTDTLDSYRPQSRVERTMQWATNKFQFVNMLAPWTDFAKINASIVAGAEILRATEAAAAGKATARQLRTLGESGIEPHMATRIHEAFQKGGEVRDGVHLPNTADWLDAEARRVFEGAVARDVDIAVITPGQEKPLWMSHPILGVLGQFKSFTAAATERTMIANLQRRDAQVLQGLIFSMGLGMLSYKLNSLTGGSKVSDKPADWIKESISRGGLLGWFEEANALSSKATRGGVDIYRLIGAEKPLTRFASRSAMDQLLGPTAGKIQNILSVTSAASKPSEWSEADTKSVRRLIAGQNVFFLRNLFDQVEKSANNSLGIEMKAKPENR